MSLATSINIWQIVTACIAAYLAYKIVQIFIILRKLRTLQKFNPHFIFGDITSVIEYILGRRKDTSVSSLILELLDVFFKNVTSGPSYVFWILWYPMIVTLNPAKLEVIMKSSDHINKGPEYKYLMNWLGEGLLTSRSNKWRSRRKMLTPSFHFRILNDFIPLMDNCSRDLINHLKPLVGKEIDIFQSIPLAALNTICETAMGVKMNALDDPDSIYVRSIKFLNQWIFNRMFLPTAWYDTIFYHTSTGAKYMDALKLVHDFTDKVINERKREIFVERANKEEDTDKSADMNDNIYFRSKRKRLTFMDLLLEEHLNSYDEKTGQYNFTERDIRDEVDTFMFEGHDTTATSMSWSIFLIGLYPDYQEKLYAEQYLIFGDDKTQPIDDEHLRQMKYLECFIKESLRLYPSVPFINRRLTKDIHFDDGEILPSGGTFTIPIFFLHRHHQHFPEPEIFDPDRFTDEREQNRHAFSYLPFSAGPRNCIGQRFAMNEMKIFLANLIRNFHFQSLKKLQDIETRIEVILRPEPGLPMKITERT